MTDSTRPTEPLAGETAPLPGQVIVVEQPRRRRRRGPAVVAGLVVLLVVLVVAFFVVDGLVRIAAEARVKSEIETNLPHNVQATVTVHIGGPSVIVEYLTGSFQRVEVDAPRIAVNSVPLAATIVATGVPVDLTKPVSALGATIRADQASINKLLSVPGATGGVTLGAGTIAYGNNATFLGLNIGFELTAAPKADGDRILLQPKSAKVTGGAGTIDLSKLVAAAVGSKPIPVCIAQYVPKGVSVTSLQVQPGTAVVNLEAKKIVLSGATLQTHGACS